MFKLGPPTEQVHVRTLCKVDDGFVTQAFVSTMFWGYIIAEFDSASMVDGPLRMAGKLLATNEND